MPEVKSLKRTAGWTTVAFGDVVRLCTERSSDPEADGFERYIGLEHLDPGELRVRRWGDIADGVTFTNVFRPGQVLFGKRRAYQRKVAVADFSGVCSGDIYVLEPKGDALLPELLPFICQTDAFFEHAVGTSAGSLSPRTNWESLADFEFALPSIAEQRRMVNGLVAITKASSALFELARSLDSAEAALLQHSFGCSYAEPVSTLDRVELAKLAEVRTGLAKGRAPDGTTTTKPYLAVSNVKDGYLDLSSLKDIVVERDRVTRYELRYGDVLMTEGGDLDKLGRGTVWEDQIPGCLHQNHVFAVRVDAARLEPWYLAALARSPYGRSYFLACAKRSSNLASINKAQVSAFRVPLMPLEGQRQWIACYRSIRTQQERARVRLREVAALVEKVIEVGEEP